MIELSLSEAHSPHISFWKKVFPLISFFLCLSLSLSFATYVFSLFYFFSVKFHVQWNCRVMKERKVDSSGVLLFFLCILFPFIFLCFSSLPLIFCFFAFLPSNFSSSFSTHSSFKSALLLVLRSWTRSRTLLSLVLPLSHFLANKKSTRTFPCSEEKNRRREVKEKKEEKEEKKEEKKRNENIHEQEYKSNNSWQRKETYQVYLYLSSSFFENFLPRNLTFFLWFVVISLSLTFSLSLFTFSLPSHSLSFSFTRKGKEKFCDLNCEFLESSGVEVISWKGKEDSLTRRKVFGKKLFWRKKFSVEKVTRKSEGKERSGSNLQLESMAIIPRLWHRLLQVSKKYRSFVWYFGALNDFVGLDNWRKKLEKNGATKFDCSQNIGKIQERNQGKEEDDSKRICHPLEQIWWWR